MKADCHMHMVLDGVDFGYIPEKIVLHDVKMFATPGQKIAFVGSTGAGKTTIVKLLMRFYDVDSGSIKIDGVDIAEYDKNSVRSLIGMVLQDSWLFSDTLSENIRYGNLESVEDEIIDASRQVYADNFIRQLPDGYESILNEDSDNISHGQKQLLTIARTVISKKEVLILDEATSALDTESEKIVQEALDRLTGSRTTIAIAHRLSTIKNADEICVMHEGRIVERGKHEELLALNGYYKRLNDMQAL